MQIYKYPEKKAWAKLCERPTIDQSQLKGIVENVLGNVKENGDKALIDYALKFDAAKLSELKLSEQEVKIAYEQVSQELKKAIKTAYENIYKFHKAQQSEEAIVETSKGIKCWRKSVAIEKVGLYIPGGTAPLFSSILMLGIPAKIAGCNEIVLCTPPSKEGGIHPAIVYTANLVGITKIYKTGGAQAIAAMAYGTESIPQVYKIFGPGNQYVTKAKELIQQNGVAIDMPAGPSEVLVIADDTCEPAYVAADLLSQAEHGADSQVILLSNSEEILTQCLQNLEEQLEELPRKEMATKALSKSKAILLDDLENCIEFSNIYAPEHLILATEKANELANKISNAGSVFLGNFSCESAGDYASGTNHTLPTNGFARNYSGVSLDSFVKKITFQELSKEGIQNIGKAIEIMAEAEQLFAHKNAVSLRLKSLLND